MTRERAAAELGVSLQSLRRFERGLDPAPRTVLLAAAAISAGIGAAAE